MALTKLTVVENKQGVSFQEMPIFTVFRKGDNICMKLNNKEYISMDALEAIPYPYGTSEALLPVAKEITIHF